MDKMKDLKDLLRHEVLDLRSAEDQIIEAMPAMIEKATNPQLAKSLRQHLRVTEGQRKRIDQVINLLGEESDNEGGNAGSFFSGLFGSGDPKCKAMEGIITEANKIMGENMNEEVMDAAIISAAQKVEHYEICGYGTAKAFARELGLSKVETLLNQTLNEEYEADNLLTKLAVGGGLNQKAEQASGSGSAGTRAAAGKKAAAKSASTRSNSGGNRSGSSKASAGKKSSSGGSSSSSRSGSKAASGSGRSGGKAAVGSASSGRSSSGKKSANAGNRGASNSGSRNAGAGKKSSSNSGGNKKSASKGASRGGGRGR